MTRLVQPFVAYLSAPENSTDLIVRVGLDGVRRYVSPASRTLYGIEPEELIGTSFEVTGNTLIAG